MAKNTLKLVTKNSEFSKSIKNKVRLRLLLLGMGGLLSVIVLPLIDSKVLQSTRPSWVSFGGTGFAISLLTIYCIKSIYNSSLPRKESFAYLTIIFSLLIIAAKFVFGPATLFAINPTIKVNSGDPGFAYFNNPSGILAASGVILALYLAIFAVIKSYVSRKVSPIISLPNTKTSKKASLAKVVLIILILLPAILYGGIFLLIVFLFSMSAAGSGTFYIDLLFSSSLGILLAATLALAASSAGYMFYRAGIDTLESRNLTLIITSIWLTSGLLITFQALWTVYMIVMVSIWPFKVITVTSK